MRKKLLSVLLSTVLVTSLVACGSDNTTESGTEQEATETSETDSADTTAEETTSESAEGTDDTTADSAESTESDHSDIEDALNLVNMGQEWTYDEDSDAWVLSIVTAVTNPVIEDEQGVSVCVPGAYVKGIDTDGDGTEDETSGTVSGSLVIDYDASVTSTNGQVYTAATAPVIINTGAAGYSSSTNTTAATTYAAEGYINMACGNRGKQDSYTDESGNTVYTGDAPCCLVDQKDATRFVKYNILLGNLPGSVDYFVSTGGSGGGAHASMFAMTSNHPDFYDYQIEAGAVGVYKNDDGSYDTSVTIDGEKVEISDGAWGCMAYSGITPLAEGDIAMAFEYYLDTDYDFNTSFQKETAKLLAAEYMTYINDQNLSVDEETAGFDIDGDGNISGTVDLIIEYDETEYADTNGYGGTYLNLYLAEFTENLQWYLDNLDYAEGWTWFDESGSALSDSDVAAMTTEDKATAFIEGRYAKGSSGGMGEGGPGEMGGAPSDMEGGDMSGTPSDMEGAPTDATATDGSDTEDAAPTDSSDSDTENTDADAATDSSDSSERSFANSDVAANSAGDTMDVGTPDAGTTQSAGSTVDSSNYSTYDEMLAAYQSDIAEVEAGDAYGNNQVDLYNPLNYVDVEGTENPTWFRILMGASEGDMSMMCSLNMGIALMNAGVDTTVEWQWDGGHVPSEVLGSSFSLWVDTMYGEHVDGAVKITQAAAETQTENGTEESASGTDISSWVDYTDVTNVSVTLPAAAAYRVAGASKAVPGFDVIDYGQEDYEFGSPETDARHWDKYVLKVFEENEDTLSELFNAGE